MNYTKVTENIAAQLRTIVGEKNVWTDVEAMQPYGHDEVTDPAYHHLPEAVVFPQTTEEVAAVVILANEHHFPIVPRGAGTGLACGAVPSCGGIVLSLEKMNAIEEINEDALYAVVQPGVRTADLQRAAEEKGLFYAGDPCSGDSCQIGGNIATNAGGNRAVKYGTTRHQVYAVEVVTPLGEDRGTRRPFEEAVDRLLPRSADHRLGRDSGNYHEGYAQAVAEAEIYARYLGGFRQRRCCYRHCQQNR